MYTLKRFGLGGILLLAVAALGGCGEASAPEEGLLVEEQVTVTPPPLAEVNLTFVGDIMLARTPGEVVARGEDPFSDLAPVLAQADLTVGNLECVIATSGQRVPKLYNFRCDPQNLPLLAQHIGAISVANNHAGDYGKEAFAEQLDRLEQAKIHYFGGGRNLKEAHTPLVVERNGIRIALLGYNEIELRSYEAGPETPGVAWSDDQQVVAGISAARALADFVVVYPHWGLDYQSEPSPRQRSLARTMIDAGADLVVGSHSHVTQTVEVYRDRLIVYGLGNFVFDDFKDVEQALDEPSRRSWVLRVTIDKQGLRNWDTLVARTDDSGVPRRVPGAVSPCAGSSPLEVLQCKAE